VASPPDQNRYLILCARGTSSRATLTIAEEFVSMPLAAARDQENPCFHGLLLKIPLTSFFNRA
jgi:hypothetical protein